MVEMQALPKSAKYKTAYPDGAVICDEENCGVVANRANSLSFYHCSKCLYDLCLPCGTDVTL